MKLMNEYPWPWEIFAALSSVGRVILLIHLLLATAAMTLGFMSAYLYETGQMKPEVSGFTAWFVAVLLGGLAHYLIIASVFQFRKNWEVKGDWWR